MFSADHTDPVHWTQRRVLAHAAEGQKATELEDNLCKLKTLEKMEEHGLNG